MRTSLAVFLFAALAAFVGPSRCALAEPITVPSGLHPGDQYRLAFVTSTTRDATSSDIADYNNFVTADANSVPALAALGTTWTAIASTPSTDARDNTSTNPLIDAVGVPIFTLANTLVAPTNSSLWSGNIISPILSDEQGSVDRLYGVWTGTSPDGTGLATLGGPYETQGGIPLATDTTSGYTGPDWMSFFADPQQAAQSLYAISGVLTVPEPSSVVLAFLAVAGLAVPSLRRRRYCRPVVPAQALTGNTPPCYGRTQ